MIGLPTETDADVDGMVDLAHEILRVGRGVQGRKRRPEVTLSASSFIPKPETPFQWLGMERMDELYRKQDRIAARVRRGVRFKHHGCETSFLEGVFSRGDRALGAVLERAWRGGVRFDGWEEHFRLDVWQEAFRAEGIDPERYAYDDLDPTGRLPWDAVHSRVNRKWLALELKRAMKEGTLSVCGPTDCHGCAPFARECVKGVVAETTDRPLDTSLPLLSTPSAPGPGLPACAGEAPQLAPRKTREERHAEEDKRPRYKYRGRYSKTGRTRFLGHLDLSRMILRGLRRAGIALVYSQGFNPKPKVAFGPALSVGIQSEAEYLDFETYDRLDPADAAERINQALPEGVRFDRVSEVRHGAPSLGDGIRGARYRIHTGNGFDLGEAMDTFSGRDEVLVRRERKGKVRTFDLRDEILDRELLDHEAVRLTLAIHGSGPSVRPEEALREMFGERCESFRIVREELLVEWNGQLINPLLAAAAAHAHRPAV
jgi:radical SAM-linked protein